MRKKEIKVGNKIRLGKDLYHVVNIFKDGEETLVVIKCWSKYRQRWLYDVKYKETLEIF